VTEQNQNTQRKRKIAQRTSLSAAFIWLFIAVLHTAAWQAGLAHMGYREASVYYALASTYIALMYLYFRSSLCLKLPIPFKLFSLVGVCLHACTGTIMFIMDGFSYFTVLGFSMVVPAGPAFIGLNYGFRGTLLGGMVIMSIPALGYFLVPHNEYTITPQLFYFFLAVWLIGWLIGAVSNGNHIAKKSLIVRLFKQQQEKNEIISEQNKTLDEKTAQLQQVNQTLQYLSNIDGLTCVANRRYFNEMLQSEWLRAQRQLAAHDPGRRDAPAENISLILLDIDYFKQYNDHYGHIAGDECLRQVAQVIKECLKRGGDMVARFGGEEFVVLLPATTGQGAYVVAENIREQVEALAIKHEYSKVARHITVSLGVASMDEAQDQTSTDMLKRADQALYQAKGRGRNCVVGDASLSAQRVNEVASSSG
jgi:diguanylate cyclase (GGDEF)-like protein